MISRIAAVGLAGALAAGALAQSFTLNNSPKVNDSVRYSIKMASDAMETPQGTFSFGVNLVIANKVKEVDDASVVYESITESIKILINGNEFEPPGVEDAQKPVTFRLSRQGELLDRTIQGQEGMATPLRFENMIRFTYPTGPIKVGDTWTREIAGDKAKQIVPARAKFTFEGAEVLNGVQTLRVGAAYSELEGAKPMGMVGTVWFDAANGAIVYAKATMNDVSLNQMMPPANMTFEMRRL